MPTYPRSIFTALQSALADQRAIVITGMRRTGKTTSLRWLLDQVPGKNKIYLDLERLDQREVFRENNYDLVLDYLRNRGIDPNQHITVALDEIQNVPNLPSVVKYLHDTYQIKFLLTGSSSFYLKNYFTESLAGRKVVFEMFPLTFGEFLDFHSIPYRRKEHLSEMLFNPHEYERLKGLYEEYVMYGGMPDVVLETRPAVRREILNDIFSSYINIDVRALADFRKIGELEQLMHLLALRIGNKLDITKLASTSGLSRPTVMQYLDFLEMTYVIHRLPAYAGGEKPSALARKLYFCDNGIASVLANLSEGILFENAVYNQLRSYGTLNYLTKGSEYEIDFIVKADGSSTALEAKYHPILSDDQKLRRISDRYGFSQAWLVGKYPAPGFTQFIWGGSIL
jgi:predicted AAA+ superfamily ATPase